MNEFEQNADTLNNNENVNNNNDIQFNQNDILKPKKKTKKNLFIYCILSIIGCLTLGLSIGIAIPLTNSFVIPMIINKSETTKTNVEITTEEIVDLNSPSANTINIIKKVKPSVVCITSTVQGKNFFNMPYKEADSGSGIIFHQTGSNIYIVTNYHVIQGASNVNISVNNSNLIPAKLIGKDQQADLAVISVEKTDLAKNGINSVEVAEFGDSDNSQVGEPVIAIGNALGEGNTATRGIISAVQKDVNVQNRKLNVIQTDAAINPGNSGGALVNSTGEIIGINTAKLSETTVEGVGYSISSNIAKPIIEQIMNRNTSEYPQLGIYMTNVTEEVAQTYNIPAMGVIVTDVIPGSSAEKAGIKKTDIITGFNKQPVFSPDQLAQEVKKCKVGDVVEVKLVENGTEAKTIKIKLLANKDTSF